MVLLANRPLVLSRIFPCASESSGQVLFFLFLWSFGRIASAIGKPLHGGKKRISYARICVEVDAARNGIKEFFLLGENGEWMTVYVEYDLHVQLVQGHALAACPKVNRQPESTPASNGASQEGVMVQRKGKGKITEMSSATYLKRDKASRGQE